MKKTPVPAPRKRLEIKLRMANARDIIVLLDLLTVYFELNPGMPKPESDMSLIAWGLGIINRNGCIVAVNNDDDIVGTIAFELGNFPWAPKTPYMNMVWFYVVPERRAGGTANHLIRSIRDIAVRNNMMLRIDNMWGVEAEKQDRYREINGFTYMGGNHVWFPPPPGGA